MAAPLLELHVWPPVFSSPGPESRFVPVRPMAFKKKIIAGFGTALAILILVGVVSYRTMVQNGEDRLWVTHTYLVLQKRDSVLANSVDVETSRDGPILYREDS